MLVEAVLGDITNQVVDVVVNAANSSLTDGAGVNGAIHRAAGAARLDAACAVLGHCAPGDAKLTPGYGLPARWIAHAVGPVWHGGSSGEAEVLASCYRRCLAIADEVGAKSIAFPAISTGIYGFPRTEAAVIAVTTLRETTTSVGSARLVAFDQETFELYKRLVAETA